MGVEPKIGGFYPPNHPFVHRVFHYLHHPFWGTIIFGNTHICKSSVLFRLWIFANLFDYDNDLYAFRSWVYTHKTENEEMICII